MWAMLRVHENGQARLTSTLRLMSLYVYIRTKVYMFRSVRVLFFFLFAVVNMGQIIIIVVDYICFALYGFK